MACVREAIDRCGETFGKELGVEEEEIDIIGITSEKQGDENSRNQLNGKVEEEEKILNYEELLSSKSEEEINQANHCSDKNHSCEAEKNATEIKDKLESNISTTSDSDVNSLKAELTRIDNYTCNDCSSNSSASSSTKSSRRSSISSTDNSKKQNEKQETFVNESGIMGQYSQLSDYEDDDFKSSEPYERFFFESDYLALKDNKHYCLLLQTLVALEAQRIQAIKDLDQLCEEEAKALDDPIEFVEKLQNNEPLDLPAAQNVTKLPNIPWEVYASSIGSLENLSAHPNTRATANHVEKVPQLPSNFANDSASENISPSNRGSEMIFSVSAENNILEESGHSSKLRTFNQPWTTEEQTRLEKLLQIYPQEEVESKRWEKIAKALGNRTPKQVASRTQKYFIKLARAGLPIPGRVPNVPKAGSRLNRRSNHYSTIGFRNSTFFPSYQPRVYMDDNNDDDDDDSSVGFSDDISCLSDDEVIPEELRQTNEYKELLQLKNIKRRKLHHVDQQQQQTSTVHSGYMCDGCGVSPITGPRWHCQDCPDNKSVDFCSFCIEKGIPESRSHSRHHRLELVSKDSCFFVDGDYVGMSGSTTGYNYLDPNFLPAAN
ncbi:ZZ-type zinc finger-containing protein 3-like isoform X2 [Actinia tenebrosa]|uniref:ZZ-type zinc finger-containing protein 3-like isoform X2 n=1 Tax=Actinia tenebrosa TaxID=6105 RepID=A0A6P8IGM5_ACTTE|nr:ZZ-type zinc finger-containing protein 3-like isoform X2 [Actinia tenebrosa]